MLVVEALITCSFWLTDRELPEIDGFMKSYGLDVNKSERLLASRASSEVRICSFSVFRPPDGYGQRTRFFSGVDLAYLLFKMALESEAQEELEVAFDEADAQGLDMSRTLIGHPSG